MGLLDYYGDLGRLVAAPERGRPRSALGMASPQDQRFASQVPAWLSKTAPEFAKGAALGLSTDVLGAPVDLVTMALQALGYNRPSDQVVGGSDWIAKMTGNATSGSAVETAGRMATGFIDPATVVKGAGLLGGKLPLLAGTFAGLGAKNAPMDMFKKAESMKAAGVPDRQIWADTGWTYAFPDGKPRFEIDDSGMQIRLDQLANYNPEYGAGGGSGRIHDLISHPELAKRYPADFGRGVKDHQVMNPKAYLGVFPGQPGRGAFETVSGINAESPTIDGLKSTTLHELQHAIQEREGFARGGSPEAVFAASQKRIQDVYDKIAAMEKDIQSASGAKLTELINERQKLLREIADIPNQDSYNQYLSLAGEAESRLTQKRMDLTPEQRRAQYPIDQFDVPVDQQIVRFDGDGPSMMMGGAYENKQQYGVTEADLDFWRLAKRQDVSSVPASVRKQEILELTPDEIRQILSRFP